MKIANGTNAKSPTAQVNGWADGGGMVDGACEVKTRVGRLLTRLLPHNMLSRKEAAGDESDRPEPTSTPSHWPLATSHQRPAAARGARRCDADQRRHTVTQLHGAHQMWSLHDSLVDRLPPVRAVAAAAATVQRCDLDSRGRLTPISSSVYACRALASSCLRSPFAMETWNLCP